MMMPSTHALSSFVRKGLVVVQLSRQRKRNSSHYYSEQQYINTYSLNNMKFASWNLVFAALLSVTTTSKAFVALSAKGGRSVVGTSSNAQPTPLYSSVVTDDTLVKTTSDPPPTKGGISMSVDELALTMGGRGRARLAWDCYAIGVDPALFYGQTIQLGHDDFETIYELLPSNRRSNRLGPDSLSKLASLYPETGKVEGGVASLSYVSQSGDGTTKLLLRLADGLEVETVIIPWKGVRSTLCISSQVGCRQVRSTCPDCLFSCRGLKPHP